MENLKEMYRWNEIWDGGNSSELFETLEEAKVDANKHVRNIRWTQEEMQRHQKNCEDFILITRVYINDDEEEVTYDEVDSISVSPETVNRVY